MTAELITVHCLPRGQGWECRVELDGQPHDEGYVVGVSRADLARLTPGYDEPVELVEASFRFLLEREPASSILRDFAISDIARYFPDYPDEIIRRV